MSLERQALKRTETEESPDRLNSFPYRFRLKAFAFVKFDLNKFKMPAADEVQQDVPMDDVEQAEGEEEVERFISLVRICFYPVPLTNILIALSFPDQQTPPHHSNSRMKITPSATPSATLS